MAPLAPPRSVAADLRVRPRGNWRRAARLCAVLLYVAVATLASSHVHESASPGDCHVCRAAQPHALTAPAPALAAQQPAFAVVPLRRLPSGTPARAATRVRGPPTVDRSA